MELATFEWNKIIWYIIVYVDNIKRWCSVISDQFQICNNDQNNLRRNSFVLKLVKQKTNVMNIDTHNAYMRLCCW